MSVEQEIEIGRQIEAEVRDPQVSEYVRRVGQRLVRAGGGAAYRYSFSVADFARSTCLPCLADTCGFTAA